MKKVDVVIVGAGFAGLACGKKLAEKGRSVVIVERKKDSATEYAYHGNLCEGGI